MKKVLQAKNIFVSKVKSVIKMQSRELDPTPCEIVRTAYGYRLLYKINATDYKDILTGNIVKSLDSVDLKKGDLIHSKYIRPLYRYSKSLRICEYEKDVKTYAEYVAKYFNFPSYKENHDYFYTINELVKQCHDYADINKKPLTKRELMNLIFSDRKLVEVDELFVVTTKIIDHAEKYTCEGHQYDYKLAVKKGNKYIDPLTNEEIKQFHNDVQVGDIIVETVRPLYRYAKSLRIKEDKEDILTYAKFVKEMFNSPAYAKDHSKFYEINELVRSCHAKNNLNYNVETLTK